MPGGPTVRNPSGANSPGAGGTEYVRGHSRPVDESRASGSVAGF